MTTACPARQGKKKTLPGRLLSCAQYTYPCGGFEESKPPQFFGQCNNGSAARGGNCYVATVCFSEEQLLKKSFSPVWDKSGREYVRYDVSKVHTVFHCGHWFCPLWGENPVLLRTFGAGRSPRNDINTWGNITVPDFSLSRRGEVKR